MKGVLEKLWKDACTVSVKAPYKRPDRSTGQRDEIILQDEPCKLSFFNSAISANPPVKNDGIASGTNQVIKLFLSPSADIPPGSKIEVTHHGRTTLFTHSGIPAIFTNHQEIILELYQEWA